MFNRPGNGVGGRVEIVGKEFKHTAAGVSLKEKRNIFLGSRRGRKWEELETFKKILVLSCFVFCFRSKEI